MSLNLSEHKMKLEKQNLNNAEKPQLNLGAVSSIFITDVEKLTAYIIICFPKFFDNFTNFEYGDGVDAGKDFKKILNKAKKLNNGLKNYR